jgi:hypothetical protein
MKRTLLFITLVLCATALLPAQRNNRWGPAPDPRGQHPRGWGQQLPQFTPPTPESVSVSGTLTIANGMIAVVNDGVTYIAGGLRRFIGFIDDLKEGAQVRLEGNAFAVPQNETVRYLSVQKMTLNGRDFDLGLPQPRLQRDERQQQRQPQQRFQQNERQQQRQPQQRFQQNERQQQRQPQQLYQRRHRML